MTGYELTKFVNRSSEFGNAEVSIFSALERFLCSLKNVQFLSILG